MVLPEVYAEAAQEATDEEIAMIEQLAQSYHATFAEVTQTSWPRGRLSPAERERVMAAFRALYGAIFAATHNAVWTLLAEPLLRLRAPRSWESGDMTVEEFIAHERRVIDARVTAVIARDPTQARDTAKALLELSPQAEAALRAAMSATPIGEISEIPLSLDTL
jgi:DNA-binding FadR family transcriptional regulator